MLSMLGRDENYEVVRILTQGVAEKRTVKVRAKHVFISSL